MHDIIQRPSPNFDDRPKGTKIDSVIIHYTAKGSVEEAMRVFEDPASQLSAHFTICRLGKIFQHVATVNCAWHAGESRFGCRQTFNNFSIGIELYNPGHNRGYIPYTEEQINALLDLMRFLYSKHPINPRLVLGHSDISPDRKKDPGELFPWCRLTECNLAIRPL